MKIGDKLKEARIKKGLTQKQVASEIQTTIQQISKYETGEQEPTASRLKELCKLYGVSADEILNL